MANEIAPTALRASAPTLMDHPQRLGILPTKAFWMDPEVRANPIVQKIILPAQTLLIFSGFMAWGILVQPAIGALLGLGQVARTLVSALVGGAIDTGSLALTFGISARLLRKRILANRRRADELAAKLDREPVLPAVPDRRNP